MDYDTCKLKTLEYVLMYVDNIYHAKDKTHSIYVHSFECISDRNTSTDYYIVMNYTNKNNDAFGTKKLEHFLRDYDIDFISLI